MTHDPGVHHEHLPKGRTAFLYNSVGELPPGTGEILKHAVNLR